MITKKEKHMDIKTTRKAHIYILMRRVGKNWVRVADSFFSKRDDARNCVRDLNNISKGRYKVGKMAIQPVRVQGGF